MYMTHQKNRVPEDILNIRKPFRLNHLEIDSKYPHNRTIFEIQSRRAYIDLYACIYTYRSDLAESAREIDDRFDLSRRNSLTLGINVPLRDLLFVPIGPSRRYILRSQWHRFLFLVPFSSLTNRIDPRLDVLAFP